MRSGRVVEQLVTFGSFALFGVIAGVITTFAHRVRFQLGEVMIWHGIVLSLLAVLLITIGLRVYLTEKLPAIAFAVGVVGAVFALSTSGMGHSVVIPGGGLGAVGLIWVYGSAIAVALPAIWPSVPQRRPATPSE